jgi:hypothetical protein
MPCTTDGKKKTKQNALLNTKKPSPLVHRSTSPTSRSFHEDLNTRRKEKKHTTTHNVCSRSSSNSSQRARRRQDRGLHLETESFTWRQRTMTDPGCAIKSKRRCHSRTTVHNGMFPAQYHLPRCSSLDHQFGSLFHLPIPRSSRVHYNFHLPNRKQKKGREKKRKKKRLQRSQRDLRRERRERRLSCRSRSLSVALSLATAAGNPCNANRASARKQLLEYVPTFSPLRLWQERGIQRKDYELTIAA